MTTFTCALGQGERLAKISIRESYFIDPWNTLQILHMLLSVASVATFLLRLYVP